MQSVPTPCSDSVLLARRPSPVTRHPSPVTRHGDTLAMTDPERRGMTVFLGRAKCGTCHFMPLFNGLTPPFYRISESEIIGILLRPTSTTRSSTRTSAARTSRTIRSIDLRSK